MTLEYLIQNIAIVAIEGPTNADVAGIELDSRNVVPGSLFVAMTGTQVDGHSFIESAITRGATAIVYEKDLTSPIQSGICYIKVPHSHEAIGELAARFYDYPSRKIKLTGITGTNGKTTTVSLLFRLFRSLGYGCGMFSTISNYINDTELETHHTTPDVVSVNKVLARMWDEGCQYAFMEVSSHAIDQGRIHGLDFAGGIFSNITHDHLDYHKTFAEYIRCKKRFFDELTPNAFALTNIDDKNGMVMVQNTPAKVATYSCRRLADFNARIMESSLDGMMLHIDQREVWTSFIGKHNAYNLLAVYATAVLLGADNDEVLRLISEMKAVRGRLEYVKGGDNITAVIDYAHTPDALQNVLSTLKECLRPTQKMLCVVGCGGNRDKTKRPEMAQIAVQYADLCIFTSDNPRNEDPDEILHDMMEGLTAEQRDKHLCITNRREAIKTAVRLAPTGSLILIAGKGHETYQEVKGVRSHFDDKEIVNDLLCCTN